MSPEVATTPQRSALRKLAQVRAEPRGVLSVYADLDPTLFPTPKARHTEADALTNEAKNRFVEGADVGHDESNRRLETIERLSDVLNDPDIAKGGTHTLAVFAAPAADVFEVVRLPEPVAPTVLVDDTPFLRPIVNDVGPRRWVVALIDRRNARILYGGPERLIEVESFEDNVPSHQKQGGWSQARYQRHSDNAAQEHITNACRRLFEFYERVHFDALAVASPDASYNEIVEALHPYLREVFQGRVRIEVDFPKPAQVLDCAQPLFAQTRERATAELLDTLEEAARERVATGPSDVLQALSERRVDTLVIDGDFATAGVRCPSCGWIGLDRSTCPWDETKLEERPDVVDDAVDLALLQSARVVTVDDDAERHPPKPLSALLRF